MNTTLKASKIEVTVANPKVVDKRTGKTLTRTKTVPVGQLSSIERQVRKLNLEIKRYRPV